MGVTLVTGGTGFVGRQLIAELVKRDVLVRTTARDAQAATTLPSSVATHIVGDLTEYAGFDALLQNVDCVIHLAARAHVTSDRAGDNSNLYRISNETLTRRLAEAAARRGVKRFVMTSTIKVFGEMDRGRPFRADDRPAPVDAYGRSKWAAEQALWSVSRETAMQAVVVRPPLVYGPAVRANFLRIMRVVDRGIPVPFSAVNNRRSMVSSDNLVDFLCACRQDEAAAGKTLLVSDDHDLSTPELLREIARAMHRKARLLWMPVAALRAVGRVTGTFAEISRLTDSLSMEIADSRAVLGWTPPVAVDAGIEKTVKSYLATRCGHIAHR